MGANAQTTVQKFLSGAVLTAEQQNFSAATGVPVFATTVTRDAAFGGANKVLAEGQLAYIEATDVVQYYDGAAWATVGPSSSAVSAQDSNYVATRQTTTSTTYAALTTAQAITLTTGTKVLVMLSAANDCGATNVGIFMGFAVSGATTIAAADGYATNQYSDNTNTNQVAAIFPLTVTAGVNTFTARFRTVSNTAAFANRTITVLAVS